MFEFLEKLRAKPSRAKKQIAFFVALSISGLIFVVWLSVLYPNFLDEQAQIEASNSGPSPVSHFADVLSSGFSVVSDQVKTIKDSLHALSSSTMYYQATSTATSTQNQ